ncbi:MAG: MFS transporter [Acidobacteria bacterium]|nr:MFS transporter [Acidobacteriota bacterium]
MNRTALTQTILYALAFISLGLITGSLGPTLPALAAQTHVSASEISRLFIARALGTIVAAATLGKLYDRYAGHPVLAAALFGGAATMLLVPHLDALPWLFSTFVGVGICSLVINVGGHTLVAAANPERAALFLNAIHFTFGLGGFLAPLIAKQFAKASGALPWTYGVFAFVIVTVALSALFVPSPNVKHHQQRTQTAPPQHATSLLLLLLLFLFLEVGAEGIVSGWMFSYAQRSGAESTLAYDMNSGFWAAFTLGRLAGIPLAWRLRPHTIILMHLCGWLALTVVLCFLPVVSWSLWLCAAGMGLGMAPVFPSTMALAQRTLHVTGKMTGWLLFGAACGGMFGPWLVGQLIGRFGPRVFLWIVLGQLIGALAVIVYFFSRAEKEAPDDATVEVLPSGEEPI